MVYQISLKGVKPFSINKAHYKSGVRTRENRDWAHEVHKQIAADPQFLSFKKLAKKARSFHISLSYNIPKEKYYTKTGKISRLTSDLTNVEKLLVDVIFDKRFHNREKDGIKYVTLEVDDCLVEQVLSRKGATASPEYSIDVKIHALI